MKACTQCSIVKQDNGYYRTGAGKLFGKCKECHKKTCLDRYHLNPEQAKRRAVNYWHSVAKHDKSYIKSKKAKRRQSEQRIKLTKEQTSEMKEIYALAAYLSKHTNQQWHVDHIVPLHGKGVCGLHVPWNLQAVPARKNLAKGNRLQ